MAEPVDPPVRVELLGPLRLVVDGVPVEVRGTMRRAVLVLLALAEGRTVTLDQFADALWPSEPPDSARQALYSHVFRLRGHLGAAAGRLETRPDGYRLAVGREHVDLAHAKALLGTARSGVRRDPAGALELLREALALWRGPVLADLTDITPIAAAVEGCAQLHREVTDALVACAVEAGRADEVLGLAGEAVAADPLREPGVLLLMRALAATGQAAEALRVGREFRHRLADETGLDPSVALRDLERDIASGSAGPAPARADGPARAVTRLFGRDSQVADLRKLLASERLVTVVGPGGVGKTRVALEIARQTSGSTVLPLASVTDPTAIPHALASALHLTVQQGDVLSACLALLGDHPGLLVLDSCEHVLDTVADTVNLLLSSCPELTVLATSREPLGLEHEYVSRLAPLPLPDDEEDLVEVPSVALFLDRARRVRPGIPPTAAETRVVADIVRRLDGMPLAIELAASRLSTFSTTDLRDRLDRTLDLLGRDRAGGDPRHRTLRATLDWSHQLLTDDERRLFRHLSVFVDGLDLDDAERLGEQLGLASDPGKVLARLVDASMIEPDFEGTTRFRMLETLRAYGLDQLAMAGEVTTAEDRLLGWAVALCHSVQEDMGTEREPWADATLRRELPNLRAAWQLARSRQALDEAAGMVTSLYDAVAYRDLVEVRAWAEELADDSRMAGHPRLTAVLGTAAEAAYMSGDHDRADRLARAGIEAAGDDRDVWYCLLPLSVVALARLDYDEVVERSLAAAAMGGPSRESLGLAALAKAYAGDLDAARALDEQALAGATSPSMRSWGAYVAGEIEGLAGHPERAEPHYVRAVELARSCGATFLVGVSTVGLLSVRATAGRVHDSLRGYREVVDYFARTGNWTHLWVTLRNLAHLLHALGDDEPAELLVAAYDRAPDAPAVDRSIDATPPRVTEGLVVPARNGVLEVARAAIERNLER